MTKDMVKQYERHKEQADYLRYALPDEKRPTTAAGKEELRRTVEGHQTEMKKLEKRFTYDEKKELGLLESQRQGQGMER